MPFPLWLLAGSQRAKHRRQSEGLGSPGLPFNMVTLHLKPLLPCLQFLAPLSQPRFTIRRTSRNPWRVQVHRCCSRLTSSFPTIKPNRKASRLYETRAAPTIRRIATDSVRDWFRCRVLISVVFERESDIPRRLLVYSSIRGKTLPPEAICPPFTGSIRLLVSHFRIHTFSLQMASTAVFLCGQLGALSVVLNLFVISALLRCVILVWFLHIELVTIVVFLNVFRFQSSFVSLSAMRCGLRCIMKFNK